uniref:Uncharacterized protein n=1 Tax=Rhizophora mucronata TaxID=61149 RepID=A0A2P2QBI5_RHIMU
MHCKYSNLGHINLKVIWWLTFWALFRDLLFTKFFWKSLLDLWEKSMNWWMTVKVEL